MTLRKLLKGLTQGQEITVSRAHSQALAYVWGRQDGQKDMPNDTTQSERFAEAWAEHVRDFALHKSFHKTNLRDGYEHWIRTGKVSS